MFSLGWLTNGPQSTIAPRFAVLCPGSMDASPQPATKKAPYKRKLTDKRRLQNREAQRAYRARRKGKLQRLQTCREALEGNLCHEATAPASETGMNSPEASLSSDDQDNNQATAATTAEEGTGITSSTTLKKLLNIGDEEDADSLMEFVTREQPDLSSILLAGLRALKSTHPKKQKQAPKPTNTNTKTSKDAYKFILSSFSYDVSLNSLSLAAPSLTGDTDLWLERTCNGRLATPLSLEIYADPSFLPDPQADGIFLRTAAMMEVCYQNCRVLGLKWETARLHTCPSPWHDPNAMSALGLLPKSIPPDLYPTPAQMRYPHHPFMDFFPFPWFRERAIVLASLDPPAFDKWELKADIFSGGMMCWTSRVGYDGQSWDRRSWEVQPWFLKKWGWLVEEQGRMGQQSRWWRRLRGE